MISVGGHSSLWVISSWADNAGLYTKAGQESQAEQAKKQHSSTVSTPVLPPSSYLSEEKWTLLSLSCMMFYHSNRKEEN